MAVAGPRPSMSGDSIAVAVAPTAEPAETADDQLQAVLDALGDGDCRAILRAVGSTALTANECSEVCDLPLSTAYRKLELLTEAGLVDERLRIRRDGKHANQYRRRVETVSVAVPAEGDVAIELEPADELEAPTPAGR